MSKLAQKTPNQGQVFSNKNLDNIPEPSKSERLLEIIDIPTKLKDNIKYKTLSKSSVHPVAKAQQQLDFLSMDFAAWLEGDIIKLKKAWNKLNKNRNDPKAFLSFNKTLHTIKGNAAILGFDKTGMMTVPLSKLLERNEQVDEYFDAIGLMVQAITLSSSVKTKHDFKAQDEICIAFETIIKSAITEP